MMSTCLVGASLLMAGQGLAQSKNGGALSPKGDWAVNKINSGGQSYCAMSRPFEQDIVLTIGRNATEEYSLAIDFQKAHLNVGKPYKITLQPGPGQIRAYEMMPASKRAMVLRIGHDENFAKSLLSSNQLKAEIDGENYVFSVAGFEKANNELDQCMRALAGSSTRVASNDAPKIETKPQTSSSSQPIIVNAQTANIDTSKTSINIDSDVLVAEKPIMPLAAPKIVVPAPRAAVQPPPAPLKAPEIVVKTPKPIDIARVNSRVSSPSVPPPVLAPKSVSKVPKTTKLEKPVPKPAPKIVMERTRSEVQKPAIQNVPRAPQIIAAPPAPEIMIPSPTINITREASKQAPMKAPNEAPMIASKKLDYQESVAVKKTMTAREARLAVAKQNELGAQRAAPKKSPAAAPVPKVEAQPVEIARAPQVQKQQQDQLRQRQEQNKRLSSALQAATAKQKTVQTAQIKPAIQVPPPVRVKTPIKAPAISASSVPSPKSAPSQLSRSTRETEQERQQRKARLAAAGQPVKAPVNKMASINVPKPVSAPLPKVNRASIAPSTPSVSPNVLAELSKLKAENQRLSSQLNNQETRLNSFDAKNPKADEELKIIRQQMAEMQERNRKLADEAMQARGNIDKATVDVGNQAIKKIRAFEKKYEAAKSDNIALSKEIEELRRMQEDKTLKAVAGNWDLEKATKRYNEAEREIKRMGMLLEQQRVASRQEKKELEQMLFDPAVTDREQRRKMAELELKLAAAEKALQQRGSSVYARSATRTGANDVQGERVIVTAAKTNNVSAPAPRKPVESKATRKNFIPSVESKPMSITARQAPKPVPKVAPRSTPAPINTRVEAPRNNAPRAPIAKVSRVAPSQSASVTTPRTPEIRIPSPSVAQNSYGQGNLQSLLSSAGISLTGGVVKNGATQYRWNTGRVVGKGQIIPMAQARNVDLFAQNYITRAKQSCAGDFASLPSPTIGRGKSYEIACVSPTRSTSASLVFAEKDGNVIAIAHEAPTDSLDAAMDARDRVAAKL